MGTRSMIYALDNMSYTPLTQIYTQYDGYPEGVGQSIYNFLVNRTMVNGFVDRNINISNGMEDLAAQLVMYLKKPYVTGNVYIYPVQVLPQLNQGFADYVENYMLRYARECGCEYVYVIRLINNKLKVHVWGCGDTPLFVGVPQAMKDKFGLVDTDNL